ncbi:MAG: hypothetical protein AAB520_03000 [Patescibacteria group bacterium]
MSLFKRISLISLLMPLLFVVFSFIIGQKAHAANTAPVTIKVFLDGGNATQDISETKCFPSGGGAGSAGIVKLSVAGNPKEITSSASCGILSTTARPNPIPSSIDKKSVAIDTNYLLTKGFKVTGLTVFDDNGRRTLVNSTSVGTTGKAVINFGVKFVGIPREKNCKINPSLALVSHADNKINVVYRFRLTNNDDKGCSGQDFILDTKDVPSGWKKEFEQDNNELKTVPNSKIHLDTQQSQFFKLRITPPTTAVPDDYNFDALIKDPNQTNNPVVMRSALKYTISGAGCTPKKARIIPDKLSKSGKPGQTVAWEIKIKNEDSGTNCKERVVNLSKSITNNDNRAWKGSFDKDSVRLAKGEAKTVKLSITSPDGAKPGNSKTIVVKEKMEGHEASTKNIRYEIISGGHPTNTPTKKPTAKPTKKPTAKPTKKPTDGPTPTACVGKTPEFSVTPDSRTENPGKGVKYTMIIKNKDLGPCAVKHLSLGAKLPTSTWRSIFVKENLDIPKGGQATIDVAITSPNDATPGTKEITLNLKNNAGNVVNTKTVEYCVTTCTSITIQPGITYVNLAIGVDGIGKTPRIPLGGNKEPNNQNRNLNVRFIKATDNTEALVDHSNYTYNSNSEKFEGTIQLTSNTLPGGIYNIYVDGPQFLTTLYPGSVTINQGAQNNLKSDNFYLITGNINNNNQSENKIDLLDYNVFISCSIYAKSKSVCDQDANYAKYSDLNDDGKVDEDDYTLFLKEYSTQQGAILP